MSIVSDYRFRGISQTYLGPAIQGGIDYSHPSGFYVGNWNSNVAAARCSPADPASRWTSTAAGRPRSATIGLDIGTIYYYHNAEFDGGFGSAKFDNWEVYLGASWKWLSAKFFYALTDYFGLNERAGGRRLLVEQGHRLRRSLGQGGSDGAWYL